MSSPITSWFILTSLTFVVKKVAGLTTVKGASELTSYFVYGIPKGSKKKRKETMRQEIFKPLMLHPNSHSQNSNQNIMHKIKAVCVCRISRPNISAIRLAKCSPKIRRLLELQFRLLFTLIRSLNILFLTRGVIGRRVKRGLSGLIQKFLIQLF